MHALKTRSNKKIFICGLPRTGTSSLCAIFLQSGYKVAHTAYSQASIERADVVADTPVFCDYPRLAGIFPGAHFIYLQRQAELWIPSIQGLLKKIRSLQLEHPGKLQPLAIRCFTDVFGPLEAANLLDEKRLLQCYQHHQENFNQFASQTKHHCHSLDLSDSKLFQEIMAEYGCMTSGAQLPQLNINGKINDWKKLKHPNKLGSHLEDNSGSRKYYF